MAEGGREAVRVDDEVIGAPRVRQLEERIRELERLLGRKTLEVEILIKEVHRSAAKNRCCAGRRSIQTVPDEGGGRHARGGALEVVHPKGLGHPAGQTGRDQQSTRRRRAQAGGDYAPGLARRHVVPSGGGSRPCRDEGVGDPPDAEAAVLRSGPRRLHWRATS